MAKSAPARRRFLATLALYLVWVGILTAMALATSQKPPARIVPSTAAITPADDTSVP